MRAAVVLGEDEIAVLCLIADRLVQGRDRYGTLRLDHDGRDFPREALEEIADELVYVGATLVQRTRRRAARG